MFRRQRAVSEHIAAVEVIRAWLRDVHTVRRLFVQQQVLVITSAHEATAQLLLLIICQQLGRLSCFPDAPEQASKEAFMQYHQHNCVMPCIKSLASHLRFCN